MITDQDGDDDLFGGFGPEGMIGAVRAQLDAVHQAREIALPACRRAIRASGLAIRAIHLQRHDLWQERTSEAIDALGTAQRALQPFPEVASVGFLHDAEKEVAEARLTAVLVAGDPLPDWHSVGVRLPAWLNGLAEAASEVRRYLLDRLRGGELGETERLFSTMETACDMLATVDYPDAITGGLRRSVDALRAVVERTRADLTATLVQERLQKSLRDSINRS